jgi:hypothetical protein
MDMIYHRRGTKSFVGRINGESVTFSCHCDVFRDARLEVRMSLAQAQALVDRKPAREVLAGFAREAIELFTSGMTPAEWNKTYGFSDVGTPSDYPLYVRPVGVPTVVAVGRDQMDLVE